MSSPAPALARLRRPRLESAVILLAVALAAYFGVVFAFSFSPGTSPSRQGIHAAILMMDVLIAGTLLCHRRMLRAALRRPRDLCGCVRLLCCLIGGGALVYIALLHGDYAIARYHYVEEGRTGSLLNLKIYLLAAQLSCLLFLRLSTNLPASASAALAWFKPEPADVLLLSVALIPLIDYFAHNRELFSVATAARYLGVFLLIPLGALVLLHFVQRSLNADALAAPFVASLAFVHYSMPFVSSMFERPVESLFLVQVGLALTVPAIVGAAYRANGRLTTKVLVIATACSAAGSLVQAGLAGPDGGQQTAAASVGTRDPGQSDLSALLSQPLKRRPDVYLLIYDGYAAGEMTGAYGIDDSVRAYLKRSAFKVYDGAYSLFLSSRPSMMSLMDMRAATSAGIGGNNTAITFFREHGYTTNLILNAYLLQGSTPVAADVVFPPWAPESGLSVLYRGIGGGEFKSGIVFQDYDRDQWLTAKRAVLMAQSGAPRMLYAHSGFPGHSQNSGTCLPDETARYAARRAVARDEMQADIEAITSSHRDAIIIVAGDHGPFLTGDCLYMARYKASELTAAHLADRYGTTLAIRWPEEVPARIDRIEVLQDVFFEVSAYLLDNDRVWAHRLPTETAGYGGIPNGSVRNGMVMVGKDKGRPLFPK